MSTNYFAAFADSDSDSDSKVKQIPQKKTNKVKSVKKVNVKPDVKPSFKLSAKPSVKKGDGKAVGLKFQPRVKEPSKKWNDRERGGRPVFKPNSRDLMWSQIVDSAINESASGSRKKLSQRERKKLARKQKETTLSPVEEEGFVTVGREVVA